MTEFKLTPVERLMLRNQFLILRKLYPDHNYDEEIEVLQDGHQLFYEELFDQIYSGTSFDDGNFVAEILEMFRDIEHWLRSNKESIVHKDRLRHFQGFDGNNESALYSFTKYAILKRCLWQEQRKYAKDTDDFNSHIAMRATYARMHGRWREIGRRADYTEEQILSIISAAKHDG